MNKLGFSNVFPQLPQTIELLNTVDSCLVTGLGPKVSYKGKSH